MKSRQLVHFLAVYDQGSISAAAKVLHITQPALSKSIRQMEDSMNVRLFERTSKGLIPSRFGHLIARHGHTINQEVDHAMAEIRMLRDGLRGNITIGAGILWMERYLPKVVAELNRRRPALSVQLVGGLRNTLMPGLINGSIDVVCMMLDTPGFDNISKIPLFEMSHVFIARQGHPLAASESTLDIAQLAEYPWLSMYGDETARARLSVLLSANNLPDPVIAAEFTSVTSMVRVLCEGDFLAHIPDRLVPVLQTMGIVALPFSQNFWNGMAGLTYRATPEPSPEVQAFLDVVLEMAPSWNEDTSLTIP